MTAKAHRQCMRSFAMLFRSGLKDAELSSSWSPRWHRHWLLYAGRCVQLAVQHRIASQPTPYDIPMSLPPKTP